MPPSNEQAEWFDEHVKPHEPSLRGYLSKRFPSLPDHDDVVQEAYTRLLRARATRCLESAKGFLFTIARNVAIDMLRRRQTAPHEPMSDLAPLLVLEEAPGLPEALEKQHRHDMLLEAIESLPRRCREVVILRHLQGLPHKEIAERLGISPNTVKLHIIKGTKDCAAFFRTRGLIEMSSGNGPSAKAEHP